MFKNKQRVTVIVAWLILVISTAVIIFSSVSLHGIKQAYKESFAYYESLQSLVRKNNKQEEYGKDFSLSIDFNELQGINNDLIAWLYSPNMALNYPVVMAKDYDWYFRHLPDDSQGAYGTPFLDIDGKTDFSKRLNVIYGKKIGNEEMFGSLSKYKKQDYFENNPYIYLYTKQGNYRIDLKYGATVRNGEWRARAFMYEANLESLLGYGEAKTTFKSDVEYDIDDKFIVLNALEKGYDKKSYFVVGVLRPI